MKTKIELYKQYREKGIPIDDDIIIFKDYCHDFIQLCKDLKFTILGIDGYSFKDDGIYVNTIEISDFSKTNKDIENCYSLARLFIDDMLKSGKSDGYLFTLN